MTVPVTAIRTSHAITIKAGNTTIGQIQTWAPTQSRDVKPKYEINATGIGTPLEHVPGVVTTQTIQVARYDLFTEKMEEVWGTSEPLYTIANQHNPIDVEERWIKYGRRDIPLLPGQPISSATSFQKNWNKGSIMNAIGANTGTFGEALGIGDANQIEDYETTVNQNVASSVEKLWYSGCWFSSIGRNMQAQGDRIVMVNATLSYTKCRQLL